MVAVGGFEGAVHVHSPPVVPLCTQQTNGIGGPFAARIRRAPLIIRFSKRCHAARSALHRGTAPSVFGSPNRSIIIDGRQELPLASDGSEHPRLPCAGHDWRGSVGDLVDAAGASPHGCVEAGGIFWWSSLSFRCCAFGAEGQSKKGAHRCCEKHSSCTPCHYQEGPLF